MPLKGSSQEAESFGRTMFTYMPALPFAVDPSQRVSKKSRWLIACLVLVVLAGGWMRLYSVENTNVHIPIRADAKDYYSYAYNLRERGIYSRDDLGGAIHPPKFPQMEYVLRDIRFF